jgi:peroxiredoxin
VAWGVNRKLAEAVGAWWEADRQFIQPSEFVVGPDGRVVQSSYSSGPLARTEAEDVLKLVNFLKNKK